MRTLYVLPDVKLEIVLEVVVDVSVVQVDADDSLYSTIYDVALETAVQVAVIDDVVLVSVGVDGVANLISVVNVEVEETAELEYAPVPNAVTRNSYSEPWSRPVKFKDVAISKNPYLCVNRLLRPGGGTRFLIFNFIAGGVSNGAP